jgi:hypothetical protein
MLRFEPDRLGLSLDGAAGRISTREHAMIDTQLEVITHAGATRRLCSAGSIAVALAWFAGCARAAEPLLMLRHANAPGTGDPPNFKPGDCSTQRNLDAAGRAQAAQLGERLAKAGVTRAKIYSSQWCRCLETARLLKLGPVSELPALNSFFGRQQERDATLAALRGFLAGLPVDGPPVVLVTHQFTINAFTGQGTASGGGTVFELDRSGAPRALGEVMAD